MSAPPSSAPSAGQRAVAPWRLWLGAGIVALLTVSVVVSFVSAGTGPARQAPARPPSADDEIVDDDEIVSDGEIVGDAQAALDAWAAFATSGDLAALTGHFVPGGPQHRQLANEAAVVAARSSGPAYSFRLRAPEIRSAGPHHAELRAWVDIRRTGEPTQHHRWDIALRRTHPSTRWRLWTVTTAPG